jgi:hypothetical protein
MKADRKWWNDGRYERECEEEARGDWQGRQERLHASMVRGARVVLGLGVVLVVAWLLSNCGYDYGAPRAAVCSCWDCWPVTVGSFVLGSWSGLMLLSLLVNR